MSKCFSGALWMGALGIAGSAVAHGEEAPLPQFVVTANRVSQNVQDVPSSIEVVSEEALERTVASDFMDLLKKNVALDVIQYPNGLAGIGLRGFRPDFEFSINPRTLTLVDGRPSGSTSFTTLAPESIARVEVLKGPASALYGPSAVGGVVNIITKRSTGPRTAALSAGLGAFDTRRAEASGGGSISDSTDFDVGLGYFDQDENFRTGDGVTRPNSGFERLSGRVRVGGDLGASTRVDASIDGAWLDNDAPGPVSFSPQTPSSTKLARLGGDLRLQAKLDAHELRATAYGSGDEYEFFTIPVTGDRYRSSRTETGYGGLQLQDSWQLASIVSLTYGADWQRVELKRFSYGTTGEARAPSSPNEVRDGRAVFAEAIFRLFDERLIVTAGGREDWITAETLHTPLLTTFKPGESRFTVFTPRGGVVLKLTPEWRLHGTAGKAFAPPQGNQIAGQGEEFAGAQRRLSTGNPDLRPERSTSYDFGVGYARDSFAGDLTYFDTESRDRITSVIVTSTPTLRELTYVNADRARFKGVEGNFWMDAGHLLGGPARRVTLSSSFTRLLTAEEVVTSVESPVRNVADWKFTFSATVAKDDSLSATLTARYEGERWDTDNSQGFLYTAGTGGRFEYDPFTVLDLSARWSLTPRDTLRADISNLLDRSYYEKGDYIMPGRAAYLRYTRRF